MAQSPQRAFCPEQELVVVEEMEASASRMIYGCVSWVAVGCGPTVTMGRDWHGMAHPEAAQNSKDTTVAVITWSVGRLK